MYSIFFFSELNDFAIVGSSFFFWIFNLKQNGSDLIESGILLKSLSEYV